MALEADHPSGEHGVFQVGELLLDHAALLVTQLLSQHLLGGGGGHAAEFFFLRGDIKHHRVADLGVIGNLLHFGKGDLVVFALNFLNNYLRGQNSVALLLQVQAHIEVGEVVLFEGVFADPEVEGAAVALVALK